MSISSLNETSKLARRVRELLEQKQLTQKEVAEKLDVTPSSVNQWLSGKTSLTVERVKALADVLGVHPRELFADAHGGEPVKSFTPGDTPPSGYVAIPEYKLSFAAGGPNGEPEWEETHEAKSRWYSDEFFASAGLDPARCKRFKVVGDSMEPTLYANDRVLIEEELDPHGVNIEDGAIYVINLEGDCRIKRLAKIKNGIRVISDNADKYPPEDYTGDEADRILIYGRVYEINRRI